MGIIRERLALIALTLVVFACGTQAGSEENAWPVNFEELIALHCRAIDLRETRFEIADSLRFYHDSLTNGVDTSISNEMDDELKALYRRQEIVSKEGYALADTIRVRMTLVMKELNPDQKRSFNDSVTVALQRMGCDVSVGL